MMKPKHWQLLQKTVPAPPGLSNAKTEIDTISRLYLLIEDESGLTGIGEASPMRGYSPDFISDCNVTLSHFLPLFMDRQISSPEDIATIAAAFPPALPSARFALETALLDLLARCRSIPLWALFVTQDAPVRVNALLSENQFEEHARNLFESGIRTFKIKVGKRKNFRNEISQLKWLRDTFGDDIEIRLDANGAFTDSNLVHKLNELSRYRPEYIEEPTPFTVLVPGKLPIPYAFDESLAQMKNPYAITAHPMCNALVLKPTLLGGFFQALKLARLAKETSRKVVITHMFESLPGYLASVHLAIAAETTDVCGLYPHPAMDAVSPSRFFHMEGDSIHLRRHDGLGVAPEDIIDLVPKGA